MASKKKNTVAIALFVAVAVIFFIAIIILAVVIPDDGETPSADNGMRYDYMDVDITWNSDRSCHITQDIQAQFLEAGSHGIYVDIPVNSGEKVRNLKIETSPSRPYSLSYENGNKIIRAKIGDSDKTFYVFETLRCKISYDYITPVHPSDKNVLALNAIGSGWTSRTEVASVTVTYPAAPENAGSDYGIWVGTTQYATGIESVSKDGIAIQWSADNKKVEISIVNHSGKYALNAFEKVELAYKMPSGVLTDYSDTEFVVILVVGVIFVLAAVLLKLLLAKNKPLTPIVDFYPPRIDGVRGEKRHMLPVQMGKIIDGGCSPQDITSLIFYWASKGYIEIEDKDGETYFKKLADIDEVTTYERKMFNKLFSTGKEEDGKVTVALSSLKGSFGTTITETKKAVDSEYRGKLYKKGFIALCVIMFVLSAVFGFGFAALTSLRVGWALIDVISGVLAVVFEILLVCGGVLLVLYYHKLKQGKRYFITGLYVLCSLIFATLVALIIPAVAMSVFEKVIFAIGLGVSNALAPFFIVRTPFYDEQLNSILGFRNFLRDAEKERLEALLADDPQYYYDILPYANVLGVSDIWADKFKDMTLEPPSYYRGGNVSVFDIIVLNHIVRNVGSSLSYVPPKVNAGSFSGGGRSSGGGGGGFSGGSFGGGGGGRW